MSCRNKDFMEHIPYVPRPTLRGVSTDAHCKHGLQLELPFHTDGPQLPCRQISYFPFHGHFAVCHYTFEPALIRKRNERERHRVRCVNEGYARLREHLPHEFDDKRLSKVETLRAAIGYIKHLQNLLDLNASEMDAPPGDTRNRAPAPQRTERSSDGESRTGTA